MTEEKVITIQQTSKRLKLAMLISWALITLGVIMILSNAGEDNHGVVWGSLISLGGFGTLAVTRIRIWWNHK